MKNVYLASTLLAASLTCSLSGAASASSKSTIHCDNNGLCFTSVTAERVRVSRHTAKRHHSAKRDRSKRTLDANGNTASRKSPPWNMVQVRTVQGFLLTVHPAYAHKFLRFFEILEQNNVKVPKEIIGCFSHGGHVRGSNHYIGAACDIQTGWNRTIPALYHAGKWIRQAGLFDGCSFGDCGHIEAVRGTHNRAPNLYTSVQRFKIEEATLNYQP